MRRLIICCTMIMLFALAGQAVATSYYNVGEWGAGPLEPQFLSWNPNYVVADYYRIVKINWRVTNNGPHAYTDVHMVLPFTWDDGAAPFDKYTWEDANNEWVIYDQGMGFDGVDDGCYARIPTAAYTPSPAPPTETRILMSDTDLPLNYSYPNYEATSVLATDSVPAWELSASLAMNATLNFSTYIQVERGSLIEAFYVQPYIVSTVPEPATLVLLGAGALLGLLRKR